MSNTPEPTKIVSSRREFILAASGSLVATAIPTALGGLSLAHADEPAGANPSAQNTPSGSSEPKTRSVAIVWKEAIVEGAVEITYAKLHELDAPKKDVKKSGEAGDFRLKPGVQRLEIEIDEAMIDVGAKATRVTVTFVSLSGQAAKPKFDGFTFLLRDVMPANPIFIPDLKVAVLAGDDRRTYDQIEAEITAKKWKSNRDLIEAEPEETYEDACSNTRPTRCPTWLGVGRDMRMFHVIHNESYGYWGSVQALDFTGEGNTKLNPPIASHNFIVGRGTNCSAKIERRLDDGALPILKSIQYDEDIEYRLTLFATLEREPLRPDNVRGTHWLAAYRNTLGSKLTDKETAAYKELYKSEVTNREQELICWVHVEVVNTGNVPRYAYFQVGRKPETGFFTDKNGKVTGINRLNGNPIPQSEMAVLVEPKESMTLELIYPHRPISKERAEAFAKQDYKTHYQACRAFWQDKLKQGARVALPEVAVDERIRAGILHLDIATQGMSKEGPLLANVGYYPPIGSESAPIIQAYDSFGYHELAERCIQLFLNRQREDGFIMTYENYQLETGPVLWTIGEHYRYTRDKEWLRRIQPNVVKACKYILDWRKRNMKEELRGKGYGLLEGRVADPFDYYHAYMLNGTAYVGLKRIAEVYGEVDANAVAELKKELPLYLADIRASFADNMMKSPVVALGDGTWVPSFSPWAEYAGPVSLYADGGNWFSHGIFSCRDSLIGSLYLGIGEVLDPKEQLAEWMLRVHQELMTYRNAGLSQPYYCRHDWLHLKRGEVKQFLKTYYNQFAALQDRETYSFWEHYFGSSQHKTHEEAWFLMQSRWMLWHEDYDNHALHLLSMIPRNWLEAGKEIKLEKCASYYGPFSLSVRMNDSTKTVEATLEFHGPAEHYPKMITLRLPHPLEKQPTNIDGGKFDAKTETVELKPTGAKTKIVVRYA